MAGCLCDACSALCCRYFALPIDNPDCRKDFDNIRWYLVHENVVVFIEKKQWYIGIMNRCKHLQADNRCGIYETRPQLFRQYSTENCDYHGGDYGYERLFTSADDLWAYGQEFLRKQRAEKAKKQGGRTNGHKRRRPGRRTETLVLSLARANVPSGPAPAQSNGNGRTIPLPLLRA
jgi:Fe-S-cluster containining protein